MEELKAGLTSAGQAALVARREAEQAKKAAENASNSGPASTSRRSSARFSGSPGNWVRGRFSGSRGAGARAARAAPRLRRRVRSMAVIGTDGKFKELDPSFCRLVGYQEHEFAKAAWPSPHDRQLYARHGSSSGT